MSVRVVSRRYSTLISSRLAASSRSGQVRPKDSVSLCLLKASAAGSNTQSDKIRRLFRSIR
ncbi:hypothetical protein D3C71_1575640 [compost metagenome]